MPEAIALVGKIYTGVHRSTVDSDTAFKLMGFSGRTGSSAKALGSLRQFGLVEGLREKAQVSDLALQILQPASNAEKAQAVLTAVRQPELYAQIFTRFDGRIPPSDEPILAFLIREAGFSKTGANDFLSSLRESAAYAEQFSTAVEATDEAPEFAEEPGDDALDDSGTHPRVESPVRSASPSQMFRIPLARACTAELRLEGEITSNGLDVLIRHLELMKEVWTEE